jgi:hypothetical protein
MQAHVCYVHVSPSTLIVLIPYLHFILFHINTLNALSYS